MDQQTRHLQNMILKQESELCQLRAELSRQGRAIDLMSEKLNHTTFQVHCTTEKVNRITEQLGHTTEQLNRMAVQLNRTNNKVTHLFDDITDLYGHLSPQGELMHQAMDEMSQIRSRSAALRNQASEDTQARALLAGNNASLRDWAASVMPRRWSHTSTEDSLYWPYPPSNHGHSSMFW